MSARYVRKDLINAWRSDTEPVKFLKWYDFLREKGLPLETTDVSLDREWDRRVRETQGAHEAWVWRHIQRQGFWNSVRRAIAVEEKRQDNMTRFGLGRVGATMILVKKRR